MMIPVPNCRRPMKIRESDFVRENRAVMIGMKTPMALVARITKIRPIRRSTL